MFSTRFFLKLVSEDKWGTSCLNLTKSERNHHNVHKWTKDVNIFEGKTVLLFPINEEDFHWYLIMVVMPSILHGSDPYIAVLDSLGGKKGWAVQQIKNYLAEELKAKNMRNIRGKTFLEMRTVYPPVPQQPDGSSCGLYLVYFARQIIKEMENHTLASSLVMDTSNWFQLDALENMRLKLALLIKETAGDQGNHIQLPDLQFLATAAQDKAEKRKANFYAANEKNNITPDNEPVTKSSTIKEAYLNYLASLKKTQKDITLVRKYNF